MSANNTAHLATIDLVADVGTPAPEPAVWGLMVLGIGFAGGALRRREERAARFA